MVRQRRIRRNTPRTPPLQSTRLMDQLRERIRYLHYSFSTETLYAYWVRFFIRWHGVRHPRDMGAPEVEAFLSMLANERRVSASTHNQALSALLLLYREVPGIQLPWLDNIQRPSAPKRIPAVLTKGEVATLRAALPPTDLCRLVARLLYGTGMRLLEGLRLRVKDLDFDRHAQLGAVEVPHALEPKYPRVGESWGWFWAFPSPTLSVDQRSGVERRHHLLKSDCNAPSKRRSRLQASTNWCR